jgi:hypothetical protein
MFYLKILGLLATDWPEFLSQFSLKTSFVVPELGVGDAFFRNSYFVPPRKTMFANKGDPRREFGTDSKITIIGEVGGIYFVALLPSSSSLGLLTAS